MSILFGLLSALAWGGGDFFGGLASRKIGAYRAVFYGEILGLGLLFIALAVVRESLPGWNSLLLALVAGAIGSVGLLILYHAIVSGQMSIVMPVSALLAAALPVAVGALLQGLPGPTKLAGFALALLAVWLVAQEDEQKTHLKRLSDLRLPLLAGLCFGTYFIMMHQASTAAVVWPMVASRSGGTLIILLFIVIFRQDMRMNVKRAWPQIGLNAVLDVGGNLFYILASQLGRLDVSAVLSSLYPGATVLLAWVFLKERINRVQWIGILAALAAIALLSV